MPTGLGDERLWWCAKLDAASGNQCNDHSGNNWLGSLSSTGIWQTDVNDGSRYFYFNGSFHITRLSGPAIDWTAGKTWSWWRRKNNAGTAMAGTPFSNLRWQANWWGFYTNRAVYDNDFNNDWQAGVADEPAGVEWQSIIVTMDGSKLRQYVDGVLFAESVSVPAIPSFSDYRVGLGCAYKQNAASSFFVGGLDDLRIFDRVITPAEIVHLSSVRGVEGAAPPLSEPPVNTVLPSVTGSTVVGNTLTTTDGTWTNNPDTYDYEWERSGDGSTGWESVPETNNAYVTDDPADIGYYFRSKVTATNTGGSASAYSAAVGPVTSNATPPVNTTPPSITGNLVVGETLTVIPGSWT